MTGKRKRIPALVLALVMLAALPACGRNSQNPADQIPESSGGREVERANVSDHVFTLNVNNQYSKNPLVATSHSNQLVCDLVYENMVELDDNFQVIPNIIVEWEASDDYKNWVLTIAEEGHTFHDGTPVTPRDVSYSLGLSINSDRFRGRFASFKGASPGEGVVNVTLGIGDAAFIKLLNLPVIKYGTYGEDREYGNTPIGSGPYTYNENGTALVASEYFEGYRKLPVDTVYLKEYTTADAIISALKTAPSTWWSTTPPATRTWATPAPTRSTPLPPPTCTMCSSTRRACWAASAISAWPCSTPSIGRTWWSCSTETPWPRPSPCIPPARTIPRPWPTT